MMKTAQLIKAQPDKQAPRRVTQEWLDALTMQQQAIILAAIRGCDGVTKEHGTKAIVRAYRGCVLKAAYQGRTLNFGETVNNSYMNMDLISDEPAWKVIVRAFFNTMDSLPLHYFLHFIHAAGCLGYKHPLKMVADHWCHFYFEACERCHLHPETEYDFDKRLGDWDQQFWDVV